jgi:hypothetical protein
MSFFGAGSSGHRRTETDSSSTLESVGESVTTCTLKWRILCKRPEQRVAYEHHFDYQQFDRNTDDRKDQIPLR